MGRRQQKRSVGRPKGTPKTGGRSKGSCNKSPTKKQLWDMVMAEADNGENNAGLMAKMQTMVHQSNWHVQFTNAGKLRVLMRLEKMLKRKDLTPAAELKIYQMMLEVLGMSVAKQKPADEEIDTTTHVQLGLDFGLDLDA